MLLTNIVSVILLGFSANRFYHYVDYNVCPSLDTPIINIRWVSVAINIYRIGMQVSYKRVWNSFVTLLRMKGSLQPLLVRMTEIWGRQQLTSKSKAQHWLSSILWKYLFQRPTIRAYLIFQDAWTHALCCNSFVQTSIPFPFLHPSSLKIFQHRCYGNSCSTAKYSSLSATPS